HPERATARGLREAGGDDLHRRALFPARLPAPRCEPAGRAENLNDPEEGRWTSGHPLPEGGGRIGPQGLFRSSTRPLFSGFFFSSRISRRPSFFCSSRRSAGSGVRLASIQPPAVMPWPPPLPRGPMIRRISPPASARGLVVRIERERRSP